MLYIGIHTFWFKWYKRLPMILSVYSSVRHFQEDNIFIDNMPYVIFIFLIFIMYNQFIMSQYCKANCMTTGPWFNIKMTSYQYRKSHCGDKTILRPSYLPNGISYAGKITSLYWIKAQIPKIIRRSFFFNLATETMGHNDKGLVLFLATWVYIVHNIKGGYLTEKLWWETCTNLSEWI